MAMKRGLRSTWMMGLCLGLMACQPSQETSLDPKPVLATPESPHLVLISLDTLRQDRGPGPWGPGIMPHLAEVAKAGILYEEAWAPSSNTLVSHGSLFTGRYPWAHGFHPHRAPPKTAPPLLPQLAELGYGVHAYTTHPAWLGRDHHFDAGTQRFQSASVDGWQVSQWLQASLKDFDGGKSAFFIHLYDAHSDTHRLPYESRGVSEASVGFGGCIGEVCASKMLKAVDEGRLALPPGADGVIEDLYDRGVRDVDEILKEIRTRLEILGPNTLYIITSDHGELLGDGGWLHHGASPGVLDIPLVIQGVGIEGGQRSKVPVSLVDVFDTLLCAGGKCPPGSRDLRDPTGLQSIPILAMNGARLGPYAAFEDEKGEIRYLKRLEAGQWVESEVQPQLGALASNPIEAYPKYMSQKLRGSSVKNPE